MGGRRLTGIFVDRIRSVPVVVLIQARRSTNISLSIDDGIGQLLLFVARGEDGIVIELVYNVDVCHVEAFCDFFAVGF